MKKHVRRWMLVAAVAAGAAAAILSGPTRHNSAVAAPAQVAVASADQLATVEQLKAEAFRALRIGEFAKVGELLDKARGISKDDATLEKMAGWTKEFETQRQGFASERQKQYEKAVEDVKKLQAAGKTVYVPDAAARAFLLAPDKKAFRAEGWVDELIKGAITHAEEYEKKEQWLKALRLYSDLGSLEPAQPVWKERLKTVTRRVRLLALYTPETLKEIQQAESKEREAADEILKPTTQPATKPAKPEAEDNFKIDWKETLRGIRMDMLWDALVDARNNYYRDTNYKALAMGGLNGLRVLVTTQGLDKAFPKLGEEAKREAFLNLLNERIAANKDATVANEQLVLRDTLARIKAENLRTIGLPEEVLVSEFADGAFAELDPFTSMIWPNDLEEFRKSTQGEFFGVGIQIQNDDDGSLKVVSPLEDTPAFKAGIKAGDIITHINGKNAKGISTNQAVRTITGPKGTVVNLTVRSPDGVSKDYAIKRDVIKVISIKGYTHLPGGGWDYYIDADTKIAYIRLTNFTAETSKELDAAVAKLSESGAKGVILDLRYNPGGLLTAATEVCDKFLTDGVIVSTRPDRETGNPHTVARAKKDADESHLPLVVLVNQYSASASEIVSGALKDQKRATIVGERTFGKGSVQMLFPLTDRSALLKLTTSHYYLPAGKCIHREENSTDWGVEPDLTVEMTPEQMRAAINARQEHDVLRDGAAPATKPAVATDKNLLSSDPQLSAAVLLLRLELADAKAKT
ncbi:S41 family peptidase [Humisphaera borealis]|uniref:S41 family peptidase n=1 Tax=Humisphaera borealis TaxID=2807512 RepID=A0A7M2WUD1_9BACT|nr:S41 family peptidase [Humisphaera borealis]QOV88140.1 S41 family peptidase [Humisphaera borealis]